MIDHGSFKQVFDFKDKEFNGFLEVVAGEKVNDQITERENTETRKKADIDGMLESGPNNERLKEIMDKVKTISKDD